MQIFVLPSSVQFLPLSQVSIKRIMVQLALNLQNLKQISKGVSKMLRFLLNTQNVTINLEFRNNTSVKLTLA